MKWIFAGLCVLLCLSADPWEVLMSSFSLMSATDHTTQAEH